MSYKNINVLGMAAQSSANTRLTDRKQILTKTL